MKASGVDRVWPRAFDRDRSAKGTAVMKLASVMRKSAAVGASFCVLGAIAILAASAWKGEADWSAPSGFLLYLTMMAGLGSLSGALGAWDSWRSGLYRVWPTVWTSAILLLLFAASYSAVLPSEFLTWSNLLGLLVPFGWITLPVWVAGWAGQFIGIGGRPKHAEPCAGSDGGLRPAV